MYISILTVNQTYSFFIRSTEGKDSQHREDLQPASQSK